MLCTVNGYSHIRSKKDGKDYTLVHVTTDIPFTNGDGFQNLNVFIEGSKNFTVGQAYEALITQYLQDGQLVARVVGLTD